MPLREDGAQPRREAASPVKIAEQRLALARLFAQSKKIRVQRICEIAGVASRIECRRRSIQQRPLLEDEMVPRAFISSRARAGEREVFEVQAAKIAFEILRVRFASGKRAFGACLERIGETAQGDMPPFAPGFRVEPLDELGVSRHSQNYALY